MIKDNFKYSPEYLPKEGDDDFDKRYKSKMRSIELSDAILKSLEGKTIKSVSTDHSGVNYESTIDIETTDGQKIQISTCHGDTQYFTDFRCKEIETRPVVGKTYLYKAIDEIDLACKSGSTFHVKAGELHLVRHQHLNLSQIGIDDTRITVNTSWLRDHFSLVKEIDNLEDFVNKAKEWFGNGEIDVDLMISTGSITLGQIIKMYIKEHY